MPNWWKGERLKELRQQRQLTQLELAEQVSVDRVTIARLETGTRNPSMDLLLRLAKVLRVEVACFLS